MSSASTLPSRRPLAAASERARPRSVALLLVLAAAASAACSSSGATWRAERSSPYATFSAEELDRFRDARAALEGGDRSGALVLMRALSVSDPENLELACWVQDVESSLLDDGGAPFDDPAVLEEEDPAEALRLAYRVPPDQAPTVRSLILAARVETDGLAAEALLMKALELDPVCSWAHYGLSHVLLEKRSQPDRWSLARESLERALAIEPGHLRARRLEAWMLAEEGSRDEAESMLRRWLEEVEDDPRVAHAERVEARLDLALLLLLRGEDGRAARMLEDLEGEPVGRARRWMLLTVARQEGGDVLGALDATLRAQGAAPGEVLPLVQEALLSEVFLDRPEVANARWQEVADLAGEGASIGDLVEGLRARVRMERRAAAQGEAP